MIASHSIQRRFLLALLICLLIAGSAQSASAQIFRRRGGGGFNQNRQTPSQSRSNPYQFRPAPAETRPTPVETRPIPVETIPAPLESRPPPIQSSPTIRPNVTVPTPSGEGGATRLPGDTASLRREVENLQRTIRDQQAKISNLDSQLKGTQASASNYFQQIQRLHQQVNTATAAATAAQGKVDQLQRVLNEARQRGDESTQSLQSEVTQAKAEAATAQQRLDRAVAEAKASASSDLQPMLKSLEERISQAQSQLDAAQESIKVAEQARTLALDEGQKTADKLRQELADSRALFLSQLQIQREVLQAEIDKQVQATAEQVLQQANAEVERRVAAAKARADEQLRDERARSATLARDLDTKTKSQIAAGGESVAKEALAQIEKAEVSAKNAQDVVQNTLGSQGLEKLEGIRRKLSGLGDTRIAAYNFSTSGQISLNLSFQTVYGRIDVGDEIYDAPKLKAAFQSESQSDKSPAIAQGSWNQVVPRFRPPEWVLAKHPLLSRRDTSDYAIVREHAFKEYGRDRAGISSERFASWSSAAIGPDAGKGLDAELREPATDELTDMLMLELFDTLTWVDIHVDREKLSKVAGSKSDEAANYLLFKHFVEPLFMMLLSNVQRFENDFVILRADPIAFNRDVKLRGAPDWTPNVFTAHHRAVSVALKDLVRHDNPLQASVRNLQERASHPLEKKLVRWSVPITQWLAENPDEAVPGLKPWVDFLRRGPQGGGSSTRTVGAIALNWIQAREALFTRFNESLDIDQEFLAGIWKSGQPNFDSRDPIIDLRGTEREKKLAALLESFVFGNAGKVAFQRLEFNLSDCTLNAQFHLEHRHVWTSPDELLGFVHKSMQNQFESVVGQVENQLDQVGPRAVKAAGP